MIVVENLSKSFLLNKERSKELGTNERSIKAVDNISFECRPGRVCSLLGPNGAGKTTTLRMIATILKPSSGRIEVAGLDTKNKSREVRRRIGFLTGSTGLYQRLTPNELIKYFASLYQVDKHSFKTRKDELFTKLDMHSFANKRIGQLSTGMKQKVSIVRTLIHDPEVLVFDEPTSGLDVITSENIIALIKESKLAGKTLIFSSHIMSEVELLCDDLVIIHKGEICFQDTLEVYKRKNTGLNLTEAFIKTIQERESVSKT